MMTAKDVERALKRAMKWQTGIEEEIRMREEHHRQFFVGGGKWYLARTGGGHKQDD